MTDDDLQKRIEAATDRIGWVLVQHVSRIHHTRGVYDDEWLRREVRRVFDDEFTSLRADLDAERELKGPTP